MIERPILFSAPMVCALIDGSKTQTRREVLKTSQPDVVVLSDFDATECLVEIENRKSGTRQWKPCPHGKPGDRLWVRENGWQRPELTPRQLREGADTWPPYEYDAKPLMCWADGELKGYGWKRRPSIHMPRWASRITLEITAVRVERLQDISEADACAEGATLYEPANYLSHGGWSHDARYVHTTALKSFQQLWGSINGPGSWAANPWVWVETFKVITP